MMLKAWLSVLLFLCAFQTAPCALAADATVSELVHPQCRLGLGMDVSFHGRGELSVKGYIVHVSECSPCPPGAVCKPCGDGFSIADKAELHCAASDRSRCDAPLLFVPALDRQTVGRAKAALGEPVAVTFAVTTEVTQAEDYGAYLEKIVGKGDRSTVEANLARELVTVAQAKQPYCPGSGDERLLVKGYALYAQQCPPCPAPALCEPCGPDGVYLADTFAVTCKTAQHEQCNAPLLFVPTTHRVQEGMPVIVEFSRHTALESIRW